MTRTVSSRSQHRRMSLNAFLMAAGHHEAAWRLPDAYPYPDTDLAAYQRQAWIAERGRLDAVFLADIPVLGDPARRPAQAPDPTVLLAALAASTEDIGLIGTATTTFEEPFNLARRFASLDLLSGGRAGWNMVTTAAVHAAANYGVPMPGPDERYARGEEFLEVVLGLWSSWEPGAVVADKAAGVHADPARVRRLDHHGTHFSVAGPLNVGRSAQGHPVVVQAGSSGPGVALAAKYAEAVFTAQRTLAEAQAFYGQLRAGARRAGRNPDHLKVLPGIVPVIGGTEAQAQALRDELDGLVVLDLAVQQLAELTGLPVEALALDAPLPDGIRPVEETIGSRARYELVVSLARRGGLTVRQLLVELGSGRGHRVVVGTPEQVADSLEEWFISGAADGFNVMAPVLPDQLEVFVDEVVPLLRRRGLFRSDYEGSTLREHYGLPVPGAGRESLSRAV